MSGIAFKVLDLSALLQFIQGAFRWNGFPAADPKIWTPLLRSESSQATWPAAPRGVSPSPYVIGVLMRQQTEKKR